ncbi:hypothetical protein AB0B04_32240 [Streptomyces xinghaiensis]|uniref:Uncharacterized protein n=2 Tax=Streptomyces TaxID=1883 RepID=A0A3R7F4D1_9ACTN|nr:MULTISPECIES: hypothetical protein [Streptomyces]KNE80145.1 hypothetical protein ADZ36_23695 [Streptomyces fradiae]OFA50979.1 hypothetical protein BEN35_15250 [Streptomyces fradiae]PQM19523.1 hypothetical protein Sfr7A_31625 [Streptomyces xinghaiensis]RKM90947.1 hypothetical protein SFRA_030420 [Streptomyces xinghaiensis]RNC68948.1 hypothetical protein DC095_030665 [Streptomyces xinghaiensis]
MVTDERHDPTAEPSRKRPQPDGGGRPLTIPGYIRSDRVLECLGRQIGTGSGYSTALACARLGADRGNTGDVDDYLAKAATERLASASLTPAVRELDAARPLPGSYDRIVSMVAVRPIPASWLAALRPAQIPTPDADSVAPIALAQTLLTDDLPAEEQQTTA